MDGNLLGNRIKQRRVALNMTQGDIASQIGVAVSTIQRYEKGKIDKIKLPVVEAIARAICVDPDWLIGKTDAMTLPKSSSLVSNLPTVENIFSLPKTKRVPLLGTIACGEPILAEENLDGYVEMADEVEADFALRCRGDSMVNARILDGDLVFIRQQPDVENGEIAAVLIGDEATLKRVYKYPEQVVLQPENPKYPPLVYSGEQLQDFRILGKAVAFLSRVK